MKTINVEDLIRILKKHDPKLPVVLTYRDHTDWTYVAPLLSDNIQIGGNENEGDGVYDDNGDGIDGPALIINLDLDSNEDEDED